MPERVFHLPARLADSLLERRAEVLGRTRDGLWVSLEDRESLEIFERDSALALLYFARAEYESAIRGLSVAQIEEAIRWRLARWAPVALENALFWIYRRERERLSLVALAGTHVPAAGEQVLHRHFDETLRMLADLVGRGRYDSLPIAELLVFVLEGDALLIAEEEYLRQSGDGGEDAAPLLGTDAIEARRRYARASGAALDRLGRHEFRELLPYSELERGIFISPRDDQLLSGLRWLHVPFTPWRDGVVTRRSVRQIPELIGRGKSVAVLYWNSGEWLEQLDELTSAQLECEYERRATGGKSGLAQAATEHLVSLRLEQALLRRNLLLSSKDAPELASMVDEQVAAETRALRSTLEVRPSWMTRQVAAGEALLRLAEVEQGVIEDATFFSRLSADPTKVALRPRFQGIVEQERQAVARLATLTGGVS